MSNLVIETCVLGAMQTNCYLIYHDQTKAAVVIDPAAESDVLIARCQKLGLSIKAILLTHGHFDHIMAVEELAKQWQVPVLAGAQESELLQNAQLNLSAPYLNQALTVTPSRFVADGEYLSLIGFEWQVIETPGHTAGSVCYWIEKEQVLISGDTLFLESLGRTDTPTGNTAQIIASITKKLFLLPDYTIVYPGHGTTTTIKHEKEHNPVVPYYRKNQ